MSTMTDANPRPLKRVKLDSSPLRAASSQSSLTTLPSSPNKSQPMKQEPTLKPLPPAILLVSLPALLAHPPTHKYYIPSICLSLCAFRKCLTIPALSPEIECRAWTGMAEVGMRVIAGGLHENEDYPWARNIEVEVDKALGKAAIIAQKHPSLRAYKHHITILQIQLSHWQHKTKFARTQIRNLLASFLPSDPPQAVYAAHLAAITIYTTPKHCNPSQSSPNVSSSAGPQYSPAHSPQDIHAALASVAEMEALAIAQKHPRVALLSRVICLRILIAANMWNDVPKALERIETALALSYEPVAPTPKVRRSAQNAAAPQPGAAAAGEKESGGHDKAKEEFIMFDDAFDAAMAAHYLVMAVVYYTHVGLAAEAKPRLSHLHAMLDFGALEMFPQGIVEIKLPVGPPLTIQVTHPRVFFLLAFLVSAVSRRDAAGRRPKRKVFATEGLQSCEKELHSELQLSLWANLGDVEEIEQRLARIKADLLCELINVSILRNEWDVAEKNLASLIAHTRTHEIFPYFAARITLYHAHIAHAQSQIPRAIQCYRVAAALSERDSFVNLSARAGEVIIRVGERAKRGLEKGTALVKEEDGEETDMGEVDIEEARRIVQASKALGGMIEAVGQVIEALITEDILPAKTHLKRALDHSICAHDDYMRMIILALVSAHYFHTSGDHALGMLQSCEQLAAGHGAPSSKEKAANKDASMMVGNARLGLWVGQKFLELYKRAGKEHRVQKQTLINQRLEEAVRALEARGRRG